MKSAGAKDMLLKRRSEFYPMPHKNWASTNSDQSLIRIIYALRPLCVGLECVMSVMDYWASLAKNPRIYRSGFMFMNTNLRLSRFVPRNKHVLSLSRTSRDSMPWSKNRASNTDHGGSFLNRPLVIGSHPHRKLIDFGSVQAGPQSLLHFP